MTDAQETALGIDIGGGHCRAALVTASGAILSFQTCPTPHRLDSFLRAIAALARAATDTTTISSPTVGIALPGIVDPRTGVVRCAVNLPFIEDADMQKLLREALGRPVRIDVDVNTAALAQWRRSPSQPERFVYLSIGTGVGAGVVLERELVRHTDRGCGHWGHVIVDSSPAAPLCRCGARGCLEAIVGGAAWDRLESPVAESDDTRCDALTTACLQIAAVYAPDLIALGGGVIDARPQIIRAVASRVETRRGSTIPPTMRIERAVLSSDEAGVIGAALLVLQSGTM